MPNSGGSFVSSEVVALSFSYPIVLVRDILAGGPNLPDRFILNVSKNIFFCIKPMEESIYVIDWDVEY